MVHLILASAKGNGVRYFPYSGYLGLTSVKVEGMVITKRDADLKLLPAKSLTVSVRCYESRLGRAGVLQSNVLVDYTQVLWSKPDGQDYADIGDTEHPFRITIPVRVGGFSTASFVEYRCVWRVEAVLNHSHIYGVGSRQIKHSDLPLTRYDLPQFLPPPPPPLLITESHLDRQISKPRATGIRYYVNAPKSPIGPSDLVPISIYILLNDPGVVIRSASIVIERRIHFLEPSTPTSATSPPMTSSSLSNSFTPSSHLSSSLHTSTSIPIPRSPSSSSLLPSPSTSFQENQLHGNPSTSTLPSASIYSAASDPISFSTTSVATETRPLLPQSKAGSGSSESLAPKSIVLPIVGTESSSPFTRAESGIWSKTLTVQWPAAKPSSHWGIGETVQSDLVSIRFLARVKLVVSTPYNTDSLELDEEEIFVVSTNDAERRLAMSKSHESLSEARSKSKSPRRSRRERENASVPEPPVPSPASASRAEHSHKSHSAATSASSSSSKAKGIRRPHTSAGPRDKSSFNYASSNALYGHGHGRAHEPSLLPPSPTSQIHTRGNGEDDARAPYLRRRPDTASPAISTQLTKSNVLGHVFSPIVGSIRNSTSSISTTTVSVSGMSMSSESDSVKEWEEELARIEMRSRRSSDLLGFGLKRKRVTDGGNSNNNRALVFTSEA